MLAENRAVYNTEFIRPPGFGVEPPNGLSFDDFPDWCEVIFNGDVWLISDVGTHIRQDIGGRHIELWSLRDNTVALVHEEWVNLWLKQRRKLAPLIGTDAPDFD